MLNCHNNIIYVCTNMNLYVLLFYFLLIIWDDMTKMCSFGSFIFWILIWIEAQLSINKHVSKANDEIYVRALAVHDVQLIVSGRYLFIVCTSRTYLISRPECRYSADYRMSMKQLLRECLKELKNSALCQNDLVVDISWQYNID